MQVVRAWAVGAGEHPALGFDSRRLLLRILSAEIPGRVALEAGAGLVLAVGEGLASVFIVPRREDPAKTSRRPASRRVRTGLKTLSLGCVSTPIFGDGQRVGPVSA